MESSSGFRLLTCTVANTFNWLLIISILFCSVTMKFLKTRMATQCYTWEEIFQTISPRESFPGELLPLSFNKTSAIVSSCSARHSLYSTQHANHPTNNSSRLWRRCWWESILYQPLEKNFMAVWIELQVSAIAPLVFFFISFARLRKLFFYYYYWLFYEGEIQSEAESSHQTVFFSFEIKFERNIEIPYALLLIIRNSVLVIAVVVSDYMLAQAV